MNHPVMDSRRSFVKGVAASAVAASLPAAAAGAEQTRPRLWTMVIDLNKCLGCQSCTIACKAESGASAGVFNTRVLVDDLAPSGSISFLPALCRHCAQPLCVPACPSGAIKKQTDGIVTTDWKTCTGDGACLRACPHSARAQDGQRGNKADSCDFCLDRIEKDRQPACVEACSSGARVFGDALSPSAELRASLRAAATNGQAASSDRVIYVPLRQGRK